MRKTSKVFVDAPQLLWLPKVTDWRLKRAMAAELAGEGFRLPRSIAADLSHIAQYCAPKLLPRVLAVPFRRLCAWFRALLLRLRGARVVVSQGDIPVIPRGAAVIWETYFLPPPPGWNGEGGEFRRRGGNRWVDAVERYGGRVARIAVRGSASADLLKKMFPEYAGKVVDLPFVHPEYEIAEEPEVVKRQKNADIVKIAFVGNVPWRKGLDILVEALAMLRGSGLLNFELTIAGDVLDRRVAVPDEPWIRRLPALPHAEVMALLRKSHVLAMPSRFESYGMVYLEAMASGCVAAVRDGDPQREFVDGGSAGLCLDPLSVDDVAEKLRSVVEDANLRAELAVRGLRRYKAVYSQAVARARWLDAVSGCVLAQNRGKW